MDAELRLASWSIAERRRRTKVPACAAPGTRIQYQYYYYMRITRNKQTSAPDPHREPSTFRWFFSNVFSLFRRHGNVFIIGATIAWVAQVASEAVVAYAGKSSFADLTMRLLANVSVVWELSLTLSGISVTLYLRERRLHRDTRQRLTSRITELELRLDPNRTSSRLTARGQTRKGDE
jgi:hypothetical protein